MLIVLSPSKKLAATVPAFPEHITKPTLLKESEILARALKTYSKTKLASLMGISDTLAALNVERYKTFSTPFTKDNATPALLTFKGDVYDAMQIAHYTQQDFDFAQRHLRILSGLYGVLKPLDLMQPYRLEMGTKLSHERGEDLYDFWGEQIATALDKAAKASNSEIVINLASKEYFQAIDPSALRTPILEIQFKEHRDGQYKIIGLLAKRARGMMADYIIKGKITDVEKLKHFAEGDYRYTPDLSNQNTWVFTR